MLTLEAREDLAQKLEEAFDLELLEAAKVRVRLRVAPHTWEAFRLMALEGLPVAEVAARVHLQVAMVYVAKSKVQKMLQEEIGKLEMGVIAVRWPAVMRRWAATVRRNQGRGSEHRSSSQVPRNTLMTLCPSDEKLTGLLADALSTAERDALARHVEGCASCQEQLARLTGTPTRRRGGAPSIRPGAPEPKKG